MNETHNPDLRCWVPSAHDATTDFPIQNLLLGVFKPRDGDGAPRAGVAIGDAVLDVVACHQAGLLDGAAAVAAESCVRPALNGLMALDPRYWSALRLRLSRLLRAESRELQDHPRRDEMLFSMSQVTLVLPCEIGGYTDFYASVGPRSKCREHVPPGQPAASQLQIPPDRIPRPLLQYRHQRYTRAQARRPDR